MARVLEYLVAGEWRGPDAARTRGVLDKYSGDVIAEWGNTPASDIQECVESARDRVGQLSPNDRFELLSKTAAALDDAAEDFAQILVSEVGKTVREARVEVKSAVAAMRAAADQSKQATGEVLPIAGNAGMERHFAFSFLVPAGPVCAIVPFNSPLNISAHKMASAIAAGDAVVVKPSELAPIAVTRLAQLFERAGAPPGLVNVVSGDATVGRHLCSNEGFARYSFTGSQSVARQVLASVGIRPVTLELGAAGPSIICGDADVDHAVKRCIRASFGLAGQVCTSSQRLLVHESVFEDFMSSFVKAAAALKLGDPREPDTDIGPMISLAAAERAEQWLDEAVSLGAEVLTGGHHDGSLFEPTVVVGARPGMRIVDEEVFAPIASLHAFRDVSEALQAANQSSGGLQAGVFTKDYGVALYFARGLRVGAVLINEASRFRVPNLPFGGVGSSGIGREGPKYAVEALSDLRTVVLAPPTG